VYQANADTSSNTENTSTPQFVMTTIIHIAFIALALSLFASGLLSLGPSSFADRAQAQNPSDWQRLAVRDEEFSVLMPVQPSLLIQPGGKTFSEGGEKVLGYRAYNGYADGFIFIIESYKASRPQRLLTDLNQTLGLMEPLETINLNGFSGRKYKLTVSKFSGQFYQFVTTNHLYMVTLAAKDSNHPSIARFISSFTLGKNNADAGVLSPKQTDDSIKPNADSQNAITAKETTVKAVLVWKPEPSYTESARANQRIGTVVLGGILTADGQVEILKVEKGLKDGLTEKAIEAAKNIRFLPAEKDGQAVSLRIHFEYNFNLY
jgi:TonB family protein